MCWLEGCGPERVFARALPADLAVDTRIPHCQLCSVGVGEGGRLLLSSLMARRTCPEA